jgi:hypothetical protein
MDVDDPAATDADDADCAGASLVIPRSKSRAISSDWLLISKTDSTNDLFTLGNCWARPAMIACFCFLDSCVLPLEVAGAAAEAAPLPLPAAVVPFPPPLLPEFLAVLLSGASFADDRCSVLDTEDDDASAAPLACRDALLEDGTDVVDELTIEDAHEAELSAAAVGGGGAVGMDEDDDCDTDVVVDDDNAVMVLLAPSAGAAAVDTDRDPDTTDSEEAFALADGGGGATGTFAADTEAFRVELLAAADAEPDGGAEATEILLEAAFKDTAEADAGATLMLEMLALGRFVLADDDTLALLAAAETDKFDELVA